jgi:chemotaxis response regulator CheB
VRIGIVNDLPMAVEALRRALSSHPGHRVAWVAFDGAAAVDLCAKDTPDLVLMDLVMPGMDGVEATRRIMAATPCAILIVTASVGANTSRVFDAMGHGALDAVDTPVLGPGGSGTGGATLLSKLEILAKLMKKSETVGPVRSAAKTGASQPPQTNRLVAIGASAGGPAALSAVLKDLPADFPAAVVIVQHVDRQFAEGMASWLAGHSALPVRVASQGERPSAGTVLLAGTGDHLTLDASGRLAYTPEPRDHVYRPSVDVFFHSVVQRWSGDAVGVLLTGMGQDGARGLRALRDDGYLTIAQDRATSAVYGMPKAAAALDAAVEILPMDRIARRLAAKFPSQH